MILIINRESISDNTFLYDIIFLGGIMFFSFEMFKNKMQRFSEEKIKSVVYANWYGNTILLIVIYLFIFDFLKYFIARLNLGLYYFLYIISLIIFVLYLYTRKAGFALTENRLVYVKFKHIGYKEKEVYEVMLDNIRYITVRKLFYIRIVKLSFISETGRLVKVRALFSSNVLVPGAAEFKKNSRDFYNALIEIQKVIDKGDF